MECSLWLLEKQEWDMMVVTKGMKCHRMTEQQHINTSCYMSRFRESKLIGNWRGNGWRGDDGGGDGGGCSDDDGCCDSWNNSSDGDDAYDSEVVVAAIVVVMMMIIRMVMTATPYPPHSHPICNSDEYIFQRGSIVCWNCNSRPLNACHSVCSSEPLGPSLVPNRAKLIEFTTKNRYSLSSGFSHWIFACPVSITGLW